MTDIVERLRARAWNSMNEYVGSPEGPTASYTARDFENGALMQDAADELTRLRSRVAELEKGLKVALHALSRVDGPAISHADEPGLFLEKSRHLDCYDAEQTVRDALSGISTGNDPIKAKTDALNALAVAHRETEQADIDFLSRMLGIVPSDEQRTAISSFRRQIFNVGMNEAWDAAKATPVAEIARAATAGTDEATP